MDQGISLSASPQLFWPFAIGNSLVALSFCALFAAVVFVAAKRRDLAFDWKLLLFAGFLLADAATHLARACAMLQSGYIAMEGGVDVIAGVLSALTAILLWTLIPKALSIPPFGQMLAAHDSINKQIKQREKAEEKFRALLESVSDAMLIVNESGQIRTANPKAEELFGYEPGELDGKDGESVISPRSRVTDAGKMGVFAFSPERTGAREISGLAKGGKELAIELRLTPLETEEGTMVASAIRDVTKQNQSERNFSLHYRVGQALNASRTFKEITANLLKATGEEMGWVSGSYWVPDENSNVLRCIDFWSLPKHSDTPFAQQTKLITFAPKVGLPGRVWMNNDSLWIEDVRKDTNFPRASAAWGSGICSGIAFPISFGDKVLGVCEFFSEQVQSVDDELHKTLNTFGRQVGQFVARQQMQSALQEIEERLDILVSSVSDYAIIMLDAQGRIVNWNSGAEHIYGYDAAEIAGKPFTTLLSKEVGDIGKLDVVLEKTRQDGQCKDTGQRERKDGSHFRAEIVFTALKSDQGEVRGFSTVTRDLTAHAEVAQSMS